MMSAFGGLSGSMEHHAAKAQELRRKAYEVGHAALMGSGNPTKSKKALGQLVRAASRAALVYGEAIAHAREANDEDLALEIARESNSLFSEIIWGYISMDVV